MTSSVAASDRLLDSIGSATPLVDSTDWTLCGLLLAWRTEVEALPMPRWAVA